MEIWQETPNNPNLELYHNFLKFFYKLFNKISINPKYNEHQISAYWYKQKIDIDRTYNTNDTEKLITLYFDNINQTITLTARAIEFSLKYWELEYIFSPTMNWELKCFFGDDCKNKTAFNWVQSNDNNKLESSFTASTLKLAYDALKTPFEEIDEWLFENFEKKNPLIKKKIYHTDIIETLGK